MFVLLIFYIHLSILINVDLFYGFLLRYKLIRRRVIWLIGQWIAVKFKSDLRPLLYQVILNLMQDPDLVVGEIFHIFP